MSFIPINFIQTSLPLFPAYSHTDGIPKPGEPIRVENVKIFHSDFFLCGDKRTKEC